MFVIVTCVQAELGSAEEKALTLQSQFGGQQAGLRLKLTCLQVAKEIRGTVWHSCSWLRDRGLPHNTEVARKREVLFALYQFICNLRNHISLPFFSKSSPA